VNLFLKLEENERGEGFTLGSSTKTDKFELGSTSTFKEEIDLEVLFI